MTVTQQFDVTETGRASVVRIHGSIFSDNRDPLLTALLELAHTEPARIVVDLTDVPMCDSSGLNLLVQARLAADRAGGWVRLANPTPMVRRVLQVTNLDGFLPVHPDVDSALADTVPS